ncbi:MAG: recombinase family protein [Eubacteriales bacterium]
MTSMKQIAIYSRKSKFTGKGESIDNQIELCKQYISSHLPDISAENIVIFEDEGFSGGHLDRPKFQEMMNLAKSDKLSQIVCYRLDRVSRNIGDFATLIEELNDLKVDFISIKEQFDTSSPMGRAMMYIASVFSQLERETIAERIRDNMHELAKTGRWLGGTSPTGYKSEEISKITVDGKERKAFKLTQIPQEIALVRQVYDKFLETNSLTKTETYLINHGIKTKRNNDFTRFAIKNILENPVYLMADPVAYEYFQKQEVDLFAQESDFDGKSGMMVYNKTEQKRGKTNKTRDMSDWIIAVGKHEGMIDGKTWVEVQNRLAENSNKAYRKPRSHVALLSGLIRCNDCGDYMRPKLTSRKNAEGEYLYHYLCSTKEKSKSEKCQMKNPNGNTLDALICQEIKKLSEDPSAFLEELETAQNLLKSKKLTNTDELQNLENNLAQSEAELKGMMSSLGKVAGTASEEYLLSEIRILGEKCQILKQNITALVDMNKEHALSDIEFDLLRDLLKNFGDTFETMSVEQKRLALKSFITQVYWDGENVHLFLYGSENKEDVLAFIPYSSENVNNSCEPLGENSK